MAEDQTQQGKSEIALREEAILRYWRENKIFENSLEKESPKGEFIFYEGPPTANGKPGIHHLEARAFKDVITRYRTMRGYHVRRKGGWDTHGLPVELQVEKELGLKSKKEIEDYGIGEFNKKCKESVWQFLDTWEKFTDRIGYWVDQKNPYITYENNYIESLWNVLKTVDDKKLLYKDYKVVPWCPRCGTGLSSHELAQGYETVKDLTVYVKLVVADSTYLLAWTTTPWTLPGNLALAVGPDINYVKIKIGEEFYILARERLSVIEGEYEVVEKMKGADLVGIKYEPLYNFMEANDNAYQVYPADFVTTEDGTGVVHIAPMYGQDDFELGTRNKLPKTHLVNVGGTFKEGTGFLVGKFVKDEAVAVDIIKDLAERNLLLKKEKYEHTYPHCWRCKTPLIYYARDSWYIRMSALREELVKENESINWEPKHIRDGRFGEWLKEIKDWAISRERYWGTPLPIWQDENGNIEVIGSASELKERAISSGNTYTVMRHGEGDHNIQRIVSCAVNNSHHLTAVGKERSRACAQKLKDKRIDLIISSDFARTKETAEVVAEVLGLTEGQIIFDERLREINFGKFDGKPFDEFHQYLATLENVFLTPLGSGESYADVRRRAGQFLYETDAAYQGKNILIITHESVAWLLDAVSRGLTAKEAAGEKREVEVDFLLPGESRPLNFTPLPHNDDYELDLHRPYIDEIKLISKDGKPLTRVKEVMDVWFDSGAMPFAQDHYPFENKEWLEGVGYPADYISEAIDQTRGWFYTLHAIGILMGRGKAYKNVICLGHILDAEGKKMSKSLGNIVDPWLMMDKYGADALRLWMYSVNQPGDSKNFDEKTVDELVKKVFNLTDNVLAFYKMYGDMSVPSKAGTTHILDRWIVARLNQFTAEGAVSLDNYKVFEAARAIREFVNDLSTWYLRRSRDRFKADSPDREDALSTTRFVLIGLAKYLAPFTPMFAEYLFNELKTDQETSVHLTSFPVGGQTEDRVLKTMEEARRIVSLALEKRMSSGLKIRQPLSKLSINKQLPVEYLELIKDELNVKGVLIDAGQTEEVVLDTTLTPELQEEGEVRELIRRVQELRKQQGLNPNDDIVLSVGGEANLVRKFEAEIKRAVSAREVIYQEGAASFEISR